LHDSLDHEDVDEHIKFSDHGCCDLFTPSFDHDVDSLDVGISKPLVFDDPPTGEVKNPQVVEPLHPTQIIMLRPRFPEVNSSSDQKFVETP